MVSMAVASLLLPFLPLLAGQILLNNFLSDIPAIGIADDRVDPGAGRSAAALGHALHRPLHARVRRAQLGVRLPHVRGCCVWLAPERRAVPDRLVRRVAADGAASSRWWCAPAGRSTGAGRADSCWSSTIALVGVALLLPSLPGVSALGFVPLPPAMLAVIVGITLAYVAATEIQKRWFFRRVR